MDFNTHIYKGEEYIASEIDGEVVMMNIENGTYISLVGSSKTIWNLLDEVKTINQLIDELTAKYDVSRELCEKDVLPFIEQLIENKIVLVKA
jgi:hypothetical protein